MPFGTTSSRSSSVLITTTAAAAAVGCLSLYYRYYRRDDNGSIGASNSSGVSKGHDHHAIAAYLRTLPPRIYDAVIIRMTEPWYRSVLERLPDGGTVLDVGIGTAGALLRCADLVKSKNLRIVGLDYNEYYVDAAQRSIAEAGMDHCIKVVCMSVYDEDKLNRLGTLLVVMRGAGEGEGEGEGVGDDDDVLLSGGAPIIPLISSDDEKERAAAAAAEAIRDRTQDSRVGHLHPHLVRREENIGRGGTVGALVRTDSEVQSEAASEAERETRLHDLLDDSQDNKLRRMDTPVMSNMNDGNGGGATASNRATSSGNSDGLKTPRAPPGQHDAEHPLTVHDFSPPPTPGRDHNVHWEKEAPMPAFLDAKDSTDAQHPLSTAAALLSKPRKSFDAVYFSGSMSLLPDPLSALVLTSRVLKDDTGKIYVTQTYQRRALPLMTHLKPLIKFFTTIDFGQLVTERSILDLFSKASAVLEVETHQPIKGSIDTILQCAYVSVLRQRVEEDVI